MRSEHRNKRAVVLLSGGMDSAVTLYIAKNRGFECFCLIFDYRQRHRREIESAKAVAQRAGCISRVLKIDLPWKGSSLLDESKKVRKYENPPLPPGQGGVEKIPDTYVPARNIIFLSFALSYAEAAAATAIFIGAHAQDYSGYPDCRPEFFRAFDKVISTGTKSGVESGRIKIIAPIINKKKFQIIKLGLRLCVPFESTWSCYKGGKTPCGECDSCYYRQKGFEQAGIEDPLLIRK